jgi:penicillin-binding protein 1A
VVALATRLGIEAPLRSEPSLALGTSEVSLLDLTGAYGEFATGGTAVEPHIIRRIRSGKGRVLYARPAPPSELVAEPAAIASLNGMLQTVVSSGTGKRAALADHPTAGKTGTSQDFRDAWFVGYTAHFVAGVWVGNDNGEPMRRVTGGNLPAQIWNRVMETAHRGKESVPLPGTDWRQPEDGLAAADRPAMPPPELLPWQMPTKVPPSARPLKAKPEKRAEPSRYPTSRIDEDFIARVLSDLPADAPSRTPSAGIEPPQPAAPRRPAPLPGLMSLGAGLGRLPQ